MNGGLGLLQQGLFFAVLSGLPLSLLSLWLLPRLTSRLRHWPVTTQSQLYLLWALLPVLVAITVVGLALASSLLPLVGLGVDHCLTHGEGHAHFCLVHRPAPSSHWLIIGPALLGGLLFAAVALHLLQECWETVRFSRRLTLQAREEADRPYSFLHTTTPLALGCGLFKQRIVLSTGLLDRLTADELRIVLAHESAHIARRDVWKLLLARALSLAHFPPVRRVLLDRLSLSLEFICDLDAAREVGSATRVAEVLLKVEKLYRGHWVPQPAVLPSMQGGVESNLPQRIRFLLAPQVEPQSRHFRALFLAALLLVPAFNHDGIHDLLEHVVGHLEAAEHVE